MVFLSRFGYRHALFFSLLQLPFGTLCHCLLSFSPV